MSGLRLLAALLCLPLLAGLPAVAQGQPVLSLAGPSGSAAYEGDSGMRSLAYAVRLSEPVSRTVLWRICFSSGTGLGSGVEMATRNEDYRILEPHRTTPTDRDCTSYRMFRASSRSLSPTPVRVQVTGDTKKERDERIVATLETYGQNPGAVLGVSEHTYWIYNDDSIDTDGAIVISPATLSVTEGQSATFTVKLSKAPTPLSKVVKVSLSQTQDDSPQLAYFPSISNPRLTVTPASHTFSSGNWNEPRTFTVAALEDDESKDESVELRLYALQSLVFGTDTRNYNRITASLPLNITDADPPLPSVLPEVSVTADADSTFETKGVTFTVSRTGPTASALTVRLSVSEKTSGGQEYFQEKDKGDRVVVIPAGKSSISFSRKPVADAVSEPTGELRVSILPGRRYSVAGDAGEAKVTVFDDDGSRTVVSITAAAGPVTEGTDAVYTVTRTGKKPRSELVVLLSVGEESSGGQEFVAAVRKGNRSVTIPSLEASATYRVPTLADGTDEPDGEVRVSILPRGAYDIEEGKGAASVAVQDDDDPPADTPVAAFGSAASSAGEDAGTRNVRVDLSPAPQSPFTLHYAVSGTAGSGDFRITGSGSLAVPANAATADIPVAITDDARDERDETVVLTLSEGAGYLLGSETVHTLTIQDNDEPRAQDQIVRISAAVASVSEGSDAEFELQRTGPATAALTVGLSVTETSVGGDFVASGDEGIQEAVFPAGSSSVTYSVPTQGDGADEPQGGVRVTVRNGTGYVRNNYNHSADMAIADDDATEARLSGSSDDIAENGGTKVLTVSTGRALVSPEALSVPLVFSDGARRGTDYTVSCAAAAGVTCHNLDAARPRIEFTGPSAQSVALTLTAVNDGIDEGLG
ncbi:MAG: hypothetical protein F4X92_09410, partial [Gammaproteobacteria bacterium]|nr:hypothetical protein [Gammaproteobacteria bacterium]